MAEIFFASSFHWAASGADVARFAAGVTGSEPTLTTDLAAAGGQTVIVPTGSGNILTLPLNANPGPEWALHFWYHSQTTSQAQGRELIALSNIGGDLLGVNIWNATGGFSIRRGSTAIDDVDLNAGDPAEYVLHVVEHETAGSIVLLRNGAEVYSASDIDTSRSGEADRLRLRPRGNSLSRDARFSHIVLADENLGAGALVGYAPVTSDVAPNDWAKSNGAIDHYEHLEDEPHDGDTTYLLSEDTGVGDKTRHRCSVSLPDRRIVAARAFVVARLEASGGDRLGVTYESGTADPVEDVLGDFEDAYTPRGGDWLSDDPDTSEEWTSAGLSALDVEVEHLAPEA